MNLIFRWSLTFPVVPPSHPKNVIFFYVCLVLLKVYCSDHTYSTIRVAVAATGREVISAVADKLGTADELVLVQLSSAGGKNNESGIT